MILISSRKHTPWVLTHAQVESHTRSEGERLPQLYSGYAFLYLSPSPAAGRGRAPESVSGSPLPSPLWRIEVEEL